MHDITGVRALVAAFVLVPLLADAQTMYKWKDEKGVTHFTEQPPPEDRKAEKVTPKVTPPSGPAASSPDWKVKDAEFRKRQAERGKAEQVEAKDNAARRRSCGIARQRLSTLQESNDVIRYNDKGEKEVLNERERATEIANARDLVKEYCGS